MARITGLQLSAFKSFRQQNLPLDDVTLLIGRNGSGKSNALDGLWALSRMASGDELKEAIDGGTDGPAVRGGIAGCAPVGEDRFELGCTLEERDGRRIAYSVTVAVEPVVQVVAESLVTLTAERGARRTLLSTDEPDLQRSEIGARWDNRKRGPNPRTPMRASRLLLTQVATRVPTTNQAGRDIHRVAEAVLEALSQVFVLDAVPHAMRNYVPERDVELRRNAENLSAAVADLLKDPDVRARLEELLGGLSEQGLRGITTSKSDLGDVMLALEEEVAGRRHRVPARQMSDGTLRFLAIVTAVMQTPLAIEENEPGRLLVVEELENGLHPSQAARALEVLTQEAEARRARILATTHSPAMLDALPGEDHGRVIVCDRAPDGRSRLTRLPDLPSYIDVVSRGGPGEAAVRDDLHPRDEDRPDPVEALNQLLGGNA